MSQETNKQTELIQEILESLPTKWYSHPKINDPDFRRAIVAAIGIGDTMGLMMEFEGYMD